MLNYKLEFSMIEGLNLTRAVKTQLEKDKETREWIENLKDKKGMEDMPEYFEERISSLKDLLEKLADLGFN